jgi:simple sugar transport system ATP-binding protein
MAALLELENISKYFGNVTALEGISTQVEAGSVTCVLGDNGAGKTARPERRPVPHRRNAGALRLTP